MRIALVQPITERSASLGIQKQPTGIMSLAAQLICAGFEVEMIHAQKAEIIRRLKAANPDYVGISTMTPNFPDGMEIARATKDFNKKIITVLGGWHAWGCVQEGGEVLEEILNENSPIDYVIAGEGEIALTRLLQNPSDENIPGVSVFRDGAIKTNPFERIQNLDELEDPSYEGLDVNTYRDLRTGALDLSIHAKRACRFSCKYCLTAGAYGKGVRKFSPSRTVRNIEKIVQELRPQVITFTDEDFFADIKWVEELVALLEKSECKMSFDTFAGVPDLIALKRKGKGDLLDRMVKVGFSSFTIGVESFNEKTLRAYGKEPMILATMTPDERKQPYDLVAQHQKTVQEAINFAHEHGILCVGDYMVGNMNETEEEVREGFEKFKALKNLFLAYIPVFTPYPGTPLWKEACESGRLKRTPKGGIDWSSFDAGSGAMEMDYDAKGLRGELELEFYTSLRYIKDMIGMLRKNPKSWRMFWSRYKYLAKAWWARKFPTTSETESV